MGSGSVASRTILLVDDDAVLCEMYRVKFEQAGFRVTVSHDGAHALELLKSGLKPDLILLDLIMPGTDGYAFLRELKNKHLAPCPIVVLTNQQEDVDKEEAFALGASHYIVKASATPKEILDHIVEILQAHEDLAGHERSD